MRRLALAAGFGAALLAAAAALVAPALTGAAPAARVQVEGDTITLTPETAWSPRAAAGALDEYRCFLLDPGLQADRFVTGVDITPGRRSLVHHVILYAIPPEQRGQAARVDAAAPGLGWPCFGGPGVGEATTLEGAIRQLDDAPWLGAWVPGRVSPSFLPGTGMRLRAGGLVVMQVHYSLLNRSAPDRTSARLTLAPDGAAVRPVRAMLFPAPVEVPCPKGVDGPLCDRGAALADLARTYGNAGRAGLGLLALCGKDPFNPPAVPRRPDGRASSTCTRLLRDGGSITGIGGHMHLLGRSITVELVRGDGSVEVLLDIPRWDFHWQDLYLLERPVAARAGDGIRVRCTWENSRAAQPVVNGRPRAPRYVLWGEGTVDEMCLAVLQLTPVAP